MITQVQLLNFKQYFWKLSGNFFDLGVGIRKGMIHLVWNLGWYSRTELTIPSPNIQINDGNWHVLKVHRVRQSLDVEIDGEVYNSRVTGSYYELNTANSVLLGTYT